MPKIKIANGHIVDATQKLNKVGDLWLEESKIISPSGKNDAGQTIMEIDASDCYVFPGLIDFHTHLYEGSSFGIKPDRLLATGVTAAVDAGTTGWINFADFYKNTILQNDIIIKAFVNASGVGQPGAGINEPLNPSAINTEALQEILKDYKETVLGLKVRISKGIVGENGIKPLKRVCELAHLEGVPMNVHVTNPVEKVEQFIPMFEKGDIFCHVYHGAGNTILDENNKIKDSVWKARERGVIFDAANGRSNFDFKVAAEALKEGFFPDIISSDSTAFNFNMPKKVKNLLFVMSKYLNMGMSLEKIVEAVTATPAQIMKMQDVIGTLKPGAQANVTICKLVHRKVEFEDTSGEVYCGDRILVPMLTILEGNIVFCNTEFN